MWAQGQDAKNTTMQGVQKQQQQQQHSPLKHHTTESQQWAQGLSGVQGTCATMDNSAMRARSNTQGVTMEMEG